MPSETQTAKNEVQLGGGRAPRAKIIREKAETPEMLKEDPVETP